MKTKAEEKKRIRAMSDDELVTCFAIANHAAMRLGKRHKADIELWLGQADLYRAEILRRMRTGK